MVVSLVVVVKVVVIVLVMVLVGGLWYSGCKNDDGSLSRCGGGDCDSKGEAGGGGIVVLVVSHSVQVV